MTLKESIIEKARKSNRCEICTSLNYESGSYSCSEGVIPDEEMSGSYDFKTPCQLFECHADFIVDYKKNLEQGRFDEVE